MDEQAVKTEAAMLKVSEETFIAEYLDTDIYLNADKHLGIKAGQFEMELKLSADESELLMRNRYSGISKLLKDKFESQWHKTAWRKDGGSIRFSLRLPDRPVVLKPDMVQEIMPGQVVSAYCSIPLSVQLAVCGSRLAEYPLTVLSKTWFGEPDEGVSGYSLKGQVLASMDKLSLSRIQAVCAIEIENHAAEMLRFERLCLRTEYMGLFRPEGDCIPATSKCRLIYAGRDRMSKISYLNPGGRTLSPPQLKQIQSLTFKSFKIV
ncbi:MAG: hypothetical protein PHV82_00060 [Victivallaceae bacterium]|nr:hypothetical protein [Victivallaceae bacterium]